MTNAVFRRTTSGSIEALRLLVTGLASGWMGLVAIPAVSVVGLSLAAPAAIAQSGVTSEEINQYARSVLEMDQYRNDAYTEIKDLLLSVEMDISDVNVSCSNTQDISQVPRSVRREVRGVLVAYCNQAQAVVEDNGLNPRRFNEITEAHGNDKGLYERIQQELLRLQQAN